MKMPEQPKREPVNYLYQGLNWDFIAGMSKICIYATEKYGSFDQYMDGPLEGEKSPVNHAFQHLANYVKDVPHDKFGTRADQLLAVAYNAMMEWEYERRGMGLPLNKVNINLK